MKKKLLLSLWVLLPLAVTAQVEVKRMAVGEAVALVRRYYDDFVTIARNPTEEEAFHAQKDLYRNCSEGKYLKVANEFYYMVTKGDGVESGVDKHAQLESFANTFWELSNKKGLRFSYKITGKPELRHAFSMDNDDTNTRCVMVRVEKVYEFGGRKWEYTDTVGVNLAKGQICQVTNRVFTESMLTKKKGDLTADQCLMLALASYEHKDYDNAFDLLQEALKKQSENDEIMYLLGVMAHRRQGGFKQYPRKVCDYMALFYLNQSRKGRFWLSTNMNVDLSLHFADNETEPFIHNRMLAYNTSNRKVGYMNPKGKMIIPQKYSWGTSFDLQGRAYVIRKGVDSLFVIDTNGNRIESYSRWNRRLLNAIWVGKGDKNGIIDRRSRSWIVPMSDKIVDFWVYDEVLCMYMEKNNEGLYGLKRIDGKVLLPCEYKNIRHVSYVYNGGYSVFCKVKLLVNYDEAKLVSLLKDYENHISDIPEEKLEKIGNLITVVVDKWE